MAKTERFVAPGVWLEWHYDRGNGWRVHAWRPHASATFNERRGLLRFIAWPAKTPTGDLIRGWLDGLIASVGNPPAAESSSDPQPESTLSPELLATGFGPEVFAGELDPSDPNYQCRTVL